MNRLAVGLILPLLLLATPGTATADVIFDPADADELAASLAEAYADQGVCYGWQVTVNDVSTTDESVGSNFGAGKPASSGSCAKTVEFRATITYTSESSESEDSASYDVSSTPAGVTRDDLDALGIDFDALTGDDPDVAVGKAVTALPLLAADKGLADPLSATPDTATPSADAQLTDDPGSDWWRDRGGMLLWGVGLLLAGGFFVWWVLRANRRTKRRHAFSSEPTPIVVPDSLPPEWAEPPTEPFASQKPEPEDEPSPEPAPAPEPPAEGTDPAVKPHSANGSEHEAPPSPAGGSPAEPPADRPAATEEPASEEPASSSPDEPAASTEDTQEQARPAPSDRQDKE